MNTVHVYFFLLLYYYYVYVYHIGESCLHIAIVNEDFEMVKYLVEKGNANIEERCSGSFFLPNDQKDHRQDCTNRETFKLPKETNYQG